MVVAMGVKLKLQGCQFETSFYVLPLGGCDVVLGVQWLATLGPIMWDFLKLSMQFAVGPKMVVLQGLKLQPPSFEEEHQEVRPSLAKGKGLFLQLIGEAASEIQMPENSEIRALLKEFAVVFEHPKKGLPPTRSHDHIIILKTGTHLFLLGLTITHITRKMRSRKWWLNYYSLGL